MRSKLQRSALALALVTALAATPAAATSWSVTVGGASYDLVVLETRLQDQLDLLGPERMPWWGSRDDAVDFAEATWAETGTSDVRFFHATDGTFYSFAFTTGDTGTYPDATGGAWTSSTLKGNLDMGPVAVLAPPAEIPEIDGAVLAQLALVLGVGWLLFAARREDMDSGTAA